MSNKICNGCRTVPSTTDKGYCQGCLNMLTLMFNNYRESTTSHTCPLIADEVVKQIEDKMVNKSHEVALAAKHKQHAEAIDANGYFTALNWVLSLNKKEGK